MNEIVEENFYEWLKYFEDVNRPIGDLSKDVYGDERFPKNATYDEMESHLLSKNASNRALIVLKETYIYYLIDYLGDLSGAISMLSKM